MLKNNDKAIETVLSLTKEQIETLLYKHEITNYGYGSILECLKNSSKGILGALFNSDLHYKLADIVQVNPDGVIAGLYALSKVIGVNEATLILPNTQGVLLLKESAAKCNFNLHIEICELVNVRKYREFAKIHLVALASVADVLCGNEETTLVIVDNSIKEVSYNTQITDLVEQTNKAISLNHTYFSSQTEMMIQKNTKLGSGEIRVISNEECIVQDVKEEMMRFRQKSCGTCTFCREGLYQIYCILEDITNAKAKKNDIELMNEISEAMQSQTNCTLGQVAANPVLSVIQNFNEELVSHTKKKVCPTGKCKAFQIVYIDPKMCKGCGDCIDICPQSCIEGKKGYISMIDEFDCIKCGKCINICEVGAIKNTSGRLPSLPTKLTKVGRFKK